MRLHGPVQPRIPVIEFHLSLCFAAERGKPIPKPIFPAREGKYLQLHGRKFFPFWGRDSAEPPHKVYEIKVPRCARQFRDALPLKIIQFFSANRRFGRQR
jgi:hypothetical protein